MSALLRMVRVLIHNQLDIENYIDILFPLNIVAWFGSGAVVYLITRKLLSIKPPPKKEKIVGKKNIIFIVHTVFNAKNIFFEEN